MSLFTPPPRHGPDDPGSAARAPFGLDEFLAHQSRWWREWIEAGNLWTSWWLSQLPPMGWPPGQVVAPVEDPAAPGPTTVATAATPAGMPASPRAATTLTVAEAAAADAAAPTRAVMKKVAAKPAPRTAAGAPPRRPSPARSRKQP